MNKLILFVLMLSFCLGCKHRDKPPDEPPIISETFEIAPTDFVIKDLAGGAAIYKGNLTLWESITGVSGSASYSFPDTFEYATLSLDLQVRRDDLNAAGGLRLNFGDQDWLLDFTEIESDKFFIVESDTFQVGNLSSFEIAYAGAAGVNVDIVKAKLTLYKTEKN